MINRVSPVISRGNVVTARNKKTAPGDSISVVVSELTDLEVSFELADGRTGYVEARQFTKQGLPPLASKLELFYLFEDDENKIVAATQKPKTKVDLKKLRIGDLVLGQVVEMKSIGLNLNIAGVRGWVPASQLGRSEEDGVPSQFQRGKFVGEVISVDPKKRDVVLGVRKIIERRSTKMRRLAAAKIDQGSVVEGPIVRMNKHGAFVELGGVEGLVHQTNILKYMQETDKPAKVDVGEVLSFKVLNVDRDRGKVALVFPDADKGPASWGELVSDYSVDERMTGLVKAIKKDGCTVLLDENILGWLPQSEVESMGGELRKGALVTAKISSIDPEKRKIFLSCMD